MIVFDLLCGAGHRFEGWFNSAADFASQQERSLLACPSCGSGQVKRVPSATRANLGAEAPKPVPAKPATKTPDMEGKDPFAIAQMLYSRMLRAGETAGFHKGQFRRECRGIAGITHGGRVDARHAERFHAFFEAVGAEVEKLPGVDRKSAMADYQHEFVVADAQRQPHGGE